MEEAFNVNDVTPEVQKFGMGASRLNCQGATNVAVAPVPAMVEPPTETGLLQLVTAVASWGAVLFRFADPKKIMDPVNGTA